MDVRLTWTDCDEVGAYVVPNVLSQSDLVSRPDNMDETVLHTGSNSKMTDKHSVEYSKTACFGLNLSVCNV